VPFLALSDWSGFVTRGAGDALHRSRTHGTDYAVTLPFTENDLMPRVLPLTLILASAVAVACSDQVPSSQPKSDKSHLSSDGGQKTDTSANPNTPSNPTTPTTPAPPSDTIVNPPSEPAGIHGFVVGPVQAGDSVGQAGIRGVRVTLVRSSTEVASTTTGDIGDFSFDDVADGVYLVRATPGASSPYAPGEQSNVTVRDGRVAGGSQVIIVVKKR
jgi:hypothetical protein